ncbi:unnamed protein product [Protopolystoma xenopodis]|uniref:Uncharacterized protein n=1 Tax=Protopolystoma xenopodis TaxID=117903 RepID=A0A448XIX0_9PLAT|nr:unnamed protein product [Protopolystoma xenopodis]
MPRIDTGSDPVFNLPDPSVRPQPHGPTQPFAPTSAYNTTSKATSDVAKVTGQRGPTLGAGRGKRTLFRHSLPMFTCRMSLFSRLSVVKLRCVSCYASYLYSHHLLFTQLRWYRNVASTQPNQLFVGSLMGKRCLIEVSSAVGCCCCYAQIKARVEGKTILVPLPV